MVVNNTRRVLIAKEVETALTFWRRCRGLMFRKTLPEGKGLLIAPCQSVHTFHMRFPIDIIFLDHDSRVVGLVRSLRPWRVSRQYQRAYFALEVPAGTIERTGTAHGDLLEMVVNPGQTRRVHKVAD